MALRSMQSRLLVLALAAVLAVGAATAWLGYRQAIHEVDELVDAQLAQYARIMLALSKSRDDDEIAFPEMRGYQDRTRIVFQFWDVGRGRPELILTSPGVSRSWPASVARDGYSNARIGDQSWRCFAATDENGEHMIWAGVDLHDRDQLTRDIALNNVKSYALGLPVLGFLLVLVIRRGLSPVRRMEADLHQRSPERLDPLSEDQAPAELLPLIRTMNNLFDRVARTLNNERRFTSDAAHELRTPLAALRVQLQVAQRTRDEDEKQSAVGKALHGAERMTHLVGQLLALARLEGSGAAGSADEFDLSALTEDAIRALQPAVDEKACRLEHDIAPELMMRGNPDLLAVLLRNLLDNALRYSAVGGRIEVGLRQAAKSIVLRVADDGPGVAVEDRDKLGERFQRFSSQAVEGVGLGLSIVRRVAELHGASVEFGGGLDGRGLSVTVRFPGIG
jgi:two-component system sensor histidine kinase QseC